ncbi:hypothetical protein DRW42_09865 [Pedobacter miscanthi]|uniref:Uncharacterized protein n=1 Tax=Pedobacter miscanthi TaxID=2259170 RepID=A0A366L1Z9_9SPHI|nr:hypothetical protein DRW42_09865 [Pedobacter miscanthi]
MTAAILFGFKRSKMKSKRNIPLLVWMLTGTVFCASRPGYLLYGIKVELKVAPAKITVKTMTGLPIPVPNLLISKISKFLI